MFGDDKRLDALLVEIGQALSSRRETLATAESCTGGLVGAIVTSVAGASAYYLGGVISYANSVKIAQLGVAEQTLSQHGAVSRSTVEEMAQGARRLLGATYGVAVSGIAGPAGGTTEKPVGTVHLAVAGPAGCTATQIFKPGTRDEIRQAAALGALRLLLSVMNNQPIPHEVS